MIGQVVINIDPFETRVALIEDGTVADLYIERNIHLRTVGTIYKGRVINVLPGMQSAFVDKNAFLYVSDIVKDSFIFEHIIGIESPEAQEAHAKNAALAPKIDDLLKEGEEIIVQVIKEPIGSKGARVTTHVTLPGHYLIYIPSISHYGVSKKIVDDKERDRLRKLLKEIVPEGSGAIVRTAGEGKPKEDFQKDIDQLKNLWDNIYNTAKHSTPPCLLYRDLSLLNRVVRDLIDENVKNIVIDSYDGYIQLLEYLKDLKSIPEIEVYDGSEPIFEAFGIEKEIQTSLSRRVWLKSGGYIVFDKTEALVSIDVNTGKFIGKDNQEQTIFKTNIEATKEIARQIRLRNLAGIIIIDFIDMHTAENRDKVLNAFKEEMVRDRTKCVIFTFTNLGLLEITRKRTRKSIEEMMMEECGGCNSIGKVYSFEALLARLYRALKKDTGALSRDKIIINVSEDFKNYIESNMDVFKLEFKKPIILIPKDKFQRDKFEIIGDY